MSTPVQPRPSRLRRHLRAAALGIAIQLAIGALIGVVALVFIEDLHSDDHGRSHPVLPTLSQDAGA